MTTKGCGTCASAAAARCCAATPTRSTTSRGSRAARRSRRVRACVQSALPPPPAACAAPACHIRLPSHHNTLHTLHTHTHSTHTLRTHPPHTLHTHPPHTLTNAHTHIINPPPNPAASSDKTVSTWDPRSGLSVQTYYGHANSANGVAVAPDGTTLASCDAGEGGSMDGGAWRAVLGSGGGPCFNLLLALLSSSYQAITRLLRGSYQAVTRLLPGSYQGLDPERAW